jgi:FkbM family methyltransferase
MDGGRSLKDELTEVGMPSTVGAPVRFTAASGYDAPAAQQPAFGAFAPTPLQSLLIGLAEKTPLGRGKVRWMISALIARLRPGPIDVCRFGFQQRLHHYGRHFVEKKMLLHIQDYDRHELARLRTAIHSDFRFVDLGANAGLYVFAVKSWCSNAKILAIEANPVYANRLEFNTAANDLVDVSVVNAAVGATSGTGQYYLHDESMIGAGASIEVPIVSLYDMLQADGFDRLDAIKVDIEGYEDRVLPPFFQSAPRTLWPRLMIVEIWSTAVRDLCLERGYRIIMEEPGKNTVFELTNA